MSYEARVLADSISPDGVRLTTFLATFPRFILAEVNTHRMLSRNSASSRAIPTEKLINNVRLNPFIPETFNKRVKGMGVGEEFDERTAAIARDEWCLAADDAAYRAEKLMKIGLDKSRANRLLEPFLWHTAIISATEFDNFFALRDHPAAQPEFQILARLMRTALKVSEPQPFEYGWWHLPLLTEEELSRLCGARVARESLREDFDAIEQEFKLISAGRLARVSFDTHDNWESQEKSIDRAKMLMGNGHFSPFEHVATPMRRSDLLGDITFSGNFRGWKQMRREIPNEHNFALVEAQS